MRALPWRVLLIHLRLPFQAVLAPVFLWGWLASGADRGLTAGVGLGFVAFHAFLYGGATAFNSAFDRDEGPVGGLERPPPVPPSLLPFSVVVQSIGAGLATFVGLPFWIIYSLFCLLSVAYSHPRIRLKGSPIGSLLVVGVGQGALGFLGGWAAARGEVASALSPAGVLGALAAAGLILGVYPLTQIYQVEEDVRRGDRTLAAALGPTGAMRLALAAQALGGGALVVALWGLFGTLDAAIVAAGLAVEMAYVAHWSTRFDPAAIHPNYRRVMRLNVLSAAALGGYFVVRLVLRPAP